TQEQNELPTVFVPQDGGGGNKRSFPLRNATRTVLSSIDSIMNGQHNKKEGILFRHLPRFVCG
ncbi:hypothetical protein, partial [Alistipes putredinis]|uniref:hypothetical protein n=1 Tax=Alistipes putredinis TaxID=28117 RepID=UPI003AB148F1